VDQGNGKAPAIARAKELFDHRTPIAQKKFLAGRFAEITRLVGAIEDRGAHAIIFGDRGVGKTSIASCVQSAVLGSPGGAAKNLMCIRVNCDSADTYSSLWRKVFGQISTEHRHLGMGFRPEEERSATTLEHHLEGEVSVNQVRQLLENCGKQCNLVVILDEFERLENDASVKKLLADTIKTLADFVVPVTIVFVGVGESLSQLIQEHQSLTRHLVEVPVPRLQVKERCDIIDDRLVELGMTIDESAKKTIVHLSKGLPFYVHLLGRYSVIAALERDSSHIDSSDMLEGFRQAMAHAKQGLQNVYYTATLTNQTKSQYRQCLAACALASTDPYGYFTASHVLEPMRTIMKNECKVSSFNDKLVDFCDARRAEILQRSGKERSWRYRFRDPLMGPFVLLASLEEKIITVEMISE
jgi:Cdc6-like AAA superfamily ATPase